MWSYESIEKETDVTVLKKREWIKIPPWIIMGVVIILVPIFILVAVESINTQKENTTRLLIEKGAALIRSFEAGTRTGILEMKRGEMHVQRLLTETAKQSDIIYLFITDTRGKILAHSDLSQIGHYYEDGLDFAGILQSKTIQWRQLENIFEVYQQFSPMQRPQRRPPSLKAHEDWFRFQFGRGGHGENEPESPLIIFVGLDTAPIEEARKEDARRTILITAILLLIGFAGFISLFLAQGYQSARTSLSRIKAFSDNLVENMPIGLLSFDSDSRVTSLNQRAESLLRITAPKSIGNKADAVIPGRLADLLDLVKTKAGVIEQEMECPMADGRVVPLEVIATRLKEDDDTFLGYVILFRDLTEIQQLRKEIDRSKRLASIGRLAAGVAHEIRNPLSSIKGFATYFRERYRNEPEDRKTADIMVQEVDRLNRVISQLLEFARPMNIQLKTISADTFIQHSVKMVENQAEDQGIKIVQKISSKVDNIIIDPDRMNQVLLNLYLNAFDAMGKGGILSITLSLHDEKKIGFDISDSGRGINNHDIEKIFDPYFTTKPSGTGLGLAIVYRIVEAHRGEIRVHSIEGQGTTVTIILPLPENKKEEQEIFQK
jgi:two-component system sensor histidine kinase HydH